MKRFFNVLVFGIVFGSLVFASGCGNQSSGDSTANSQENEMGEEGSVEITVVSPFDEADGNRRNFVAAYEAYEIETGNTVNDLATASSEEWKAQVIADFTTGDEPDVLFFFTGSDADDIIRNHKVVLIDEIRRQYPDYASNMKSSMMPVSTVDGRQYAVPVNGYWEGLFVNKKVLESSGVEVPGMDYSWGQFLVDCQAIKDSGYTPIAASLMEVPHYWFEYCTLNNGSLSTHLNLPQSADDAAGQAWVAGLEDIKDLYEKGFFPEDTLTAADADTAALITGDQAAFLLDGSWKVGWFQENAGNMDDFAVTFVPSKGERGTTEIIGGLSMGYYITQKAWNDPDKREAAVSFVEAMTTDEVVSSFGALSITALQNGTMPPQDVDALESSALEMTKSTTGIVSAAQDLLSPVAREAFFENVPNVMTGEISPLEAVEEIPGMR